MTKNKTTIEKELEGKEISLALFLDRYPKQYPDILLKKDVILALQKAREELKNKEIEIKTNDKKNGWIKVNLVSDIKKVF